MTTIYYLEMSDPSDLRPGRAVPELVVRECDTPRFHVNRSLYRLVGEAWDWTERLSWSDDQWRALVSSADHRTWIARCEGAIAGYYELRRARGSGVEILYFGLAPAFIGRGLGGALLTHAVESAWAWKGAGRVWVHTCSLDHPRALANYEARGFRLYSEEPDGE